MKTGETRFVFEQLYPTGEVYAVRYLDDAQGTITGAYGPLPFREVKLDALTNYDYDPELGDWMMSEDVCGVGSGYALSPLSEANVLELMAQAEAQAE